MQKILISRLQGSINTLITNILNGNNAAINVTQGNTGNVNFGVKVDNTTIEINNNDKLALKPTTVSAGNYTNTNLTVDVDGRITSASNGSSIGITIRREEPILIDGQTKIILNNTPIINSELISINGIIFHSGITKDYTIVNNTITLNAPRIATDEVMITYIAQ